MVHLVPFSWKLGIATRLQMHWIMLLTICLVAAALENEKNIHSPNWVFPEAVVDIYCGDTHPTRKNICRYRKNPLDPNGPVVTQFASSWVERGWVYNTYNIILCNRFFDQKMSLEAILSDMKNDKRNPSNVSEYKLAWGHTIYHELMHLDPVKFAS